MKASFTVVLAVAALAAASPQRPAGAPAGPLPTADSSLLAEFQSWTSAAGLSAFPTAGSQWASVTAAHPLPTGLSSYASSLTNAWGTGTGAWGPGITQGPGGWHNGAGHGPFGGANGWGNGPWASNGDFTTGAWTSWWGNDACPASTWPGWTESSWSTAAPWTSWTSCTASTTATNVYSTTLPNGVVQTTTNFGIRVAQAATDIFSGAAAKPTNFAGVFGGAAGVMGVVAGALLL